MIRRDLAFLFAVAASLAGAAAYAQEAPPACPAPASLPPELAGWSAPHIALNSAPTADRARHALATVGKPVDIHLLATPAVHYAVQPGKPGGSVSKGGIVTFDVAEAGTYRIALGAGAWLDVIEAGQAVTSSAHGHGPDCSGIRKMVDYPLKPGRHLLQLSASADPAISVLVTKLP